MIIPSYDIKKLWLGYDSGLKKVPGEIQHFKILVYTLSNSSYVLSDTFSSDASLVDGVSVKPLDVILNSISAEKSICQDSKFSILGQVTSASVSFTAIKDGVLDSVLKTLSESYYLEVYMSAGTDEVLFGYFEVSSRKIDSYNAFYVLSDFINRLNQVTYTLRRNVSFASQLSAIWSKLYVETGCEFFNSLCPVEWNNAFNGNKVPNLLPNFYNVSDGYECSCRDALKYLGEASGCCFVISLENSSPHVMKCKALAFGYDNGSTSFTGNDMQGYNAVFKDKVFSENEFALNKFRIYYDKVGYYERTLGGTYDNPSSTIVIANNPFIGDIIGATSMYYNLITGYRRYCPGELELINHPYIEPLTRVQWGLKLSSSKMSVATRVIYKLNGIMQVYFANVDGKSAVVPSSITDFRYTIPGTISQTAGSGKTSTSGTVTISLPSEFTNGLSSASYVVMVTPTASASSVLYVTGKTTTQFVVHGPASCNFDWFAVKV